MFDAYFNSKKNSFFRRIYQLLLKIKVENFLSSSHQCSRKKRKSFKFYTILTMLLAVVNVWQRTERIVKNQTLLSATKERMFWRDMTRRRSNDKQCCDLQTKLLFFALLYKAVAYFVNRFVHGVIVIFMIFF